MARLQKPRSAWPALTAALLLTVPVSSQEAEPTAKEPVEIDWKHDSRKLRSGGGAGTEKYLHAALEWLVNHQSAEGYWDCDGFSLECERLGEESCTGPGRPAYDVGVTGLVLIVLAGADVTGTRGGFREAIGRAVDWLLDQQDEETGRIGSGQYHDFMYNHLVAAYGLCDAAYTIEDPAQRARVQRAIDFVVAAQSKEGGGGWRYDFPPIGDTDTSVTAWALNLLVVARNREGFTVPEGVVPTGFEWIEEATDRETGRVGYDAYGSLSARTTTNQHYAREKAETMTAVGLWCRYLMGKDHLDEELISLQESLLLKSIPEWAPDDYANDAYYFYYGTYAMFQRGGKAWRAWNGAMKKVLKKAQVGRGHTQGSFDPIGPWGYAGGRVYTTAMMALCLEVYYRYRRFED